MQTVLATLAVATLGWVALLIIGQPIIRFFELRQDTREQMLYFANIPVPKEGAEINNRFEEAHDALRRLGAKMLAFSETKIAAPIVHRFGYDPASAGRGLIGLSNTLPTYGPERAGWRRQIEQALKLPNS